MRIPRLYLEQNIEIDSVIDLPADKAHYVRHVLRMRKGDKLVLFNGNEYEITCELIELDKKMARIEVLELCHVERESPLNITLALGISRSQHMDFALQKAVELGVSQIVPLSTEFSNVRLQDGRIANKLSHWNNIIISAAEQCGRTQLPKLFSPQLLNDWINNECDKTCLLLHPVAELSLESISMSDNTLTLLVGPEGGFSESEIKLAIEKDIVPVKLGPRILRTETAVVSVLSLAQQRWGDL